MLFRSNPVYRNGVIVGLTLVRDVYTCDQRDGFVPITDMGGKVAATSFAVMDASDVQSDAQTRFEAILPILEKVGADDLPAKQLLESKLLSTMQIVCQLNARLGVEAATPANALAALEGYARARQASLLDFEPSGNSNTPNGAAMDARASRPSKALTAYLSPSKPDTQWSNASGKAHITATNNTGMDGKPASKLLDKYLSE